MGGISLNLAGNMIEDINAICGIQHLMVLDLADNKIKNIEPLANIKLTVLNLENNQIRDIKPLLNVKTLDELNLKGNLIADINSLSKLKDMVSLIHIDNKFSKKLRAVRLGNFRFTPPI